jgi:xanthine dehydrogenase YagS FAD-binding subunit
MKTFKYKNAATLNEAVLLLKSGRAAVLAGGTDIINVLKQGALPQPPETLVNIKNITGLSFINKNKHGLKIGALTKISDIASSEVVKKDYPALAKAAISVSAPTLRNMGTLGGNLCLVFQAFSSYWHLLHLPEERREYLLCY